MALNTRRLGTTDMEITTVGPGAWAIGGGWVYGWGPSTDDLRELAFAIELSGAGSGPVRPKAQAVVA